MRLRAHVQHTKHIIVSSDFSLEPYRRRDGKHWSMFPRLSHDIKIDLNILCSRRQGVSDNVAHLLRVQDRAIGLDDGCAHASPASFNAAIIALQAVMLRAICSASRLARSRSRCALL